MDKYINECIIVIINKRTNEWINVCLGHFSVHHSLHYTSRECWDKCWDKSNKTVFQTQASTFGQIKLPVPLDLKLKHWRSEFEHITSRSRILPSVLALRIHDLDFFLWNLNTESLEWILFIAISGKRGGIFDPYSAEIFLCKPWTPFFFFQFEIIINVLGSSFRFI